ncbi:MAG: YraN family protein [Acidobacteriaceae bacterium]
MQTISHLAQARLSIFERTLGWLDHAAARSTRSPKHSIHLTTGLRGEDAAYFYLRGLGYTIVARRWSSPKLRGDIDLVGWDGEWLSFIEVKTRSSRTFQPAEVAVDHEKRTTLARMAREYIRQLENPELIPVRFDVVSVYFPDSRPEFELFRGAFDWNESSPSGFRAHK